MLPKIYCFFIATLLIIGIQPTAAQTDAYPTVTALRETEILPRDRVSLAQRFFGLGELTPPPVSVPARQVGETDQFYVMNSSANEVFQVRATLRAVGEHIYIWIESDAGVSDADAQAVADAFDQYIYDQVRALWGDENNPGVDGDPRLYALFTTGLGGSLAGYFASNQTFTNEVVPNSNGHEMFMMNLDTLSLFINSFTVEAILAHEFQHMIRANIDGNEDTWMDEGFSMFTELNLGYADAFGAAYSFLTSPRTQLNAWAENGPRAPHYGASLMFLTYFYENFGLNLLQDVSDDHANGLTAVENAIGADAMHELFADWVLANYLLDPDIGYGYFSFPEDTTGATPLATVSAYPYSIAETAFQHAADYYVLTGLQGMQNLDISFTMPEEAMLVPVAPASGSWMWYSNRADNSDTTLTRAFDLTGVSSATLNYKVWYHTEQYYDYAYVVVSTDNGATWQMLQTPFMTGENPNGLAYGVGYMGESRGWLEESISLDAYVGQQILLRFEMITDDAISQPGMVIDDVSIPEIDYSTDFETDDDRWQASGWIRTDNRLPQAAWVQAVQQTSNGIEITRWAASADNIWSLPLAQGIEQVTIVIFPYAPLTLVGVPYSLSVEGS